MSANAQYAIDIAATMSGGEKTTSELDAIAEQFAGVGRNADMFTDALATVSNALSAARANTASAGQALSESTAEYTALERAALSAARAFDKASQKGVVSPEVANELSAAKAAVDAYAVTLAGVEDKAAAARAEEERLASTLANLKTANTAVNRAADKQDAALREQERALRETEKAYAAQVKSVQAYDTAIKASADKAAKDQISALRGQSEGLSKLQGAFGSVGGPLGRLGQLLTAPTKGFTDLTEVVGKSRATMIFAAAGAGILMAAVVALTAAVVVGMVKVASWAVGLADSARSAGLVREAVEATNPAIAALSGEISAIESDTGVTADALRGFAKDLKAAKVSASDMPAALRAMAMSEAALGSGGSADFVERIKAGKVAVSALAAEAQSKLGGIVMRKMLGLEAQTARLKKNVAGVFGGLSIEPVLGGMQTLVGLFDKTSASGQALELLFGKVFQPLINQAQNASYVVEAFALGFLIGLTKLYIAIKPVLQYVGELFGFDTTSLTDVLTGAKNAGELFAKVFAVAAVVIGSLIAAFTVVASVALVFEGAVFAVFAAVGMLSKALLEGLISAVTSASGAAKGFASSVVAAIAGLPNAFAGVVSSVIGVIGDPGRWSTIGSQIVAGIARGITGAAGAVLGAIGGVVQGAITKAKQMLGIASPSKVFAGLGEYTGEGFVVGVEAQTEDAQAAMTGLVQPPPMTALRALDASNVASSSASTPPQVIAAPAAAASATSDRPSIAGNSFNFYSIKDAEDAVSSFDELLTKFIEGDATQLAGAGAT